MTLKDFVSDYLNSETVITIYSRNGSEDMNFWYDYHGTVRCLLDDERYIRLLPGKVEHISPSFHKIQAILDIHVVMN